MTRTTKQAAERRFGEARSKARRFADDMLRVIAPDLPEGLRSNAITKDALDACRRWQGRVVEWPWDDIVRQYRRDHPDRFELALWVHQHLCCLAVGYPSGSALHCSIVFIEADPTGHPLQGLAILAATTHLEAYARALGKQEARLIAPMNDRIVALTEAVGYNRGMPQRGQADFCVKVLNEPDEGGGEG